jgi:monovalent cation:H+ antiporter-2, CPA2 family
MTHSQLILDLALAWGAAGIGGLVAQRFRQPPIVGYLLAGVLVGPFTPGPVIHSGDIGVVAQIGVAFLMFALGVEFSFEEFRDLGRVVALGGPLQILGTMLLGLLLAVPLGLSVRQGLFLGGILALSSTVVALKVLMGRGELRTLHGRIAVGLLIAQDLAVVPLVVILPILTGRGTIQVTGLILLALKAAAVIVGVYMLGARVAPWLLRHMALGRSRELFLLGVVGMALGTALLTEEIGLSLAFGAFLAGLTVAESPYRTQVLAEILPLRDLFTALFFVSVGLLIDPGTLVAKLGLVVLVAGVVLCGKTALVTLVVTVLGAPLRAALLTGASIAQIGEFSFVLAGLGVQTGAIPASIFTLVLATALVTIVLSAPLLAVMPTVTTILERGGGGRRSHSAERHDMMPSGEMRNHTVICGYGRVGREVGSALQEYGLPYLVIEQDPDIVEELHRADIPVIFGDATNRTVLEHAYLGAAMLLAVLLPDAATTELVTLYARELYPNLDILARASNAEGAERLRQAGATNVVQPEFEAGVAVVGHALRRHGLSGPELARQVLSRRASFYRITTRT